MSEAEQLTFFPADPIDGIPGLRDYQAESLHAARDARDAGVRRMLVVMPTGTGKSVTLRNLPSVMGWHRTLAVAHRIELVDQLARHFQDANPHMRVEVERADQYASHDADIVVACTASLGRKRLLRWPEGHFDGVIGDELHHGLATSWVGIFRYFRCGEPDGPTLVGCTATPFRGDGKPLANLVDKIVYSRGIKEMVEAGWLCRLRAQRIRTDVDISDLHTRYGEFKDEDLARLANTDGRNSLIVSGIEQHCRDRKSIMVFCVNVEHVESLTRQLGERGHSAASILGKTPEDERAQILSDFKNGILRILVSCGVLSEGVDIPRADCAVLCRPWKTPLGYIQQVGRVLRPHPDKKDSLIVDVVDNVGRHQIQTATKLFGVRDVDVLGGDVLDAAEQIAAAADEGIAIADGDTIDQVQGKADKLNRIAKGVYIVPTVAEAIDIFAAAAIDERVRDASLFPWVGTGTDRWTLRMNGMRVVMEGDARGVWRVTAPGQTYELGLCPETPWELADAAVKKIQPDFWRTKKMDARWRNDAVSDKQRAVLVRMGFRALPPRLTKGAASDLLDVIGARKHRV